MTLTLFYAAVVVAFVVNCSTFVSSVAWLNRKPFNCAVCMTWWTCLLLVFINALTTWRGSWAWFTDQIGYVVVAAMLSLLADVIGNALTLIRDGLDKALDWLYDKLIK